MTKSKTQPKRVGLRPTDYLDKPQALRLLEYLKSEVDRSHGGRRAVVNLMLVRTFLNTGLRASEVSNLKLMDLPCVHGKDAIYVRAGKGNRSQSIAIPAHYRDCLKDFIGSYRNNRGPKTFLFWNERNPRHGKLSYASIYYKIVRIAQKAGLPHVSPHKLRHSYAAHLRAVQGDLDVVQRQLRHSRIETTKIYAAVLNEQIIQQVNGLPWANY